MPAMSIRKAASLLIIAPTNRVLFMLRPSTGSFADTHVFPGGAEESSDKSLLHCALRETFEETGLLIDPLSRKAEIMDSASITYEAALEKHFSRLLTQINWSSIRGFPKMSQWTTPPVTGNKRFMTQFYLYESDAEFSFKGIKQSEEAVRLEWLEPKEALAACANKSISFFPPQFYLMSLLSENSATKVAERVQDKIVEPKIIEKLSDGRVKMDWGDGEFGLVRFSKGMPPSDLELIKKSKL